MEGRIACAAPKGNQANVSKTQSAKESSVKAARGLENLYITKVRQAEMHIPGGWSTKRI